MSNSEFPSWMPSELFKERPDSAVVREQILGAYQKATGIVLSRPPSNEELKMVCSWINQNEIFQAVFVKPHLVLKQIYSTSLSGKIFSLAQHHCPLCIVPDGSIPTCLMSIRIPPISKQAAARKKGHRAAFERAIKHRFAEEANLFPAHMSVCVLIVFVTRATGVQKDLDNMAKALLDAIKHVLFGDDRRIDHLNIIRVKSPDEEFIHLNIRETRINTHEDVLFPQMFHSWAGAKEIRLEDFMIEE